MIQLALGQFKYQIRTFWRNGIAAFFTVALPLIMMCLLCLLFGDGTFSGSEGGNRVATFFVCSMSAMAIVGACFTNIAMTVAIARDSGLLKRYRGTPMPLWLFLSGMLSHAVFLGLVLVLVLLTVGVVFFNAETDWQHLPMFVLTLALASVTFCTLGLAITSVIRSSDSAPAIVQGTVLPLLFISDVFFPMQQAPVWLQSIASLFPIRHFSLALQSSFNPHLANLADFWFHLTILGIWLVVGVVVVKRFFSWEPHR